MIAERRRLREIADGTHDWRRWGPYLAERQWGTVREDYSARGTPWEYMPHDHARSRAYRWGEDGIAGWCDDGQRLCLSLALWNGRDPILKELYWYLDGLPSHASMKMLYRYPQAAFPYSRLVEENRRRGRDEPEFELADTGVLDGERYFDVIVEYAKAAPDDVVVRIIATNRGPDAAPLHLIPLVTFRNTWSWCDAGPRPAIEPDGSGGLRLTHHELGVMRLAFDAAPRLVACDNETNVRRLFGVTDARGPFKDGIHDLVVRGDEAAISPSGRGTRAGAIHAFQIAPGDAATIRLRLAPDPGARPFDDADTVLARRADEADEFYATLQEDIDDPDRRLVQRQALAGLLWSKQFYHYDVARWLEGDPGQPSPPAERVHGRNHEWTHLNNADVISMPDTWEYPWYASWDLAFHCLPLALIDPEFAKQQLVLFTREWYMHPNGQVPAYEWAFGDANPPVHAWAAWRVYKIDAKRTGRPDRAFLERVFHKLLLNFTWWVNRKDAGGRNLFQGGFLGLDNIGVFNRSEPLPAGERLEQADGTSWMAMYCLNLLRIAIELARDNRVYEDLATKFFEHFLYIAGAMRDIGGSGTDMWDDEDEFYYDVLHVGGDDSDREVRLKIRSIVGLIPLFAVEVLEPDGLEHVPEFRRRMGWFLEYRPDLAGLISRWHEPGLGERRLLSLLRGHRMKCLLRRLLDESEFLSPNGVRALSRHHLEQPYVMHFEGRESVVRYEPGESTGGLFGGNSNWRGPVWMPINFLIIESLRRFHHYYGAEFKVECPTGSGRLTTIDGVADELTQRVLRPLLRDASGRRPVDGDGPFAGHPDFRDLVTFAEYFHGDDGRGLGASHQTGWTALAAKLLQPERPAR